MDKNKTKKIDRLLKDILTHYDKKPGSKFKKIKEGIEKKEGISNKPQCFFFTSDQYDKLTEEEKAEIKRTPGTLFILGLKRDKDNVQKV